MAREGRFAERFMPPFEKPTDFERRFSFWFVFGESPDGRVSLNDGHEDVLVSVPKPLAEKIISLRDAYLAACEAAMDAEEG